MNDPNISPRGRPYDHGLERRLQRAACIYFIRCGDFVKIGWSVDVEKILQQMQRFNPVSVAVLGVMRNCGAAREAELHRRFAAHRVRGEWFMAHPDLVAYAAENATPWTETGESPDRLKRSRGARDTAMIFRTNEEKREQILRLADRLSLDLGRPVSIAETIELAIDALERELGSPKK